MKFIKGVLPIAFTLLFTVGAIGFISVGRLHDEASQIVDLTLPRLATSGEINAVQAENFIRALLAITADDPQERSRCLQEIGDFNREVTRAISRYRASVRNDAEKRLVDDLESARLRYHAIRAQALQLSSQGRKAEALVLVKTSLWPAYKAYTVFGDNLFDRDVSDGTARGRHIMKVCLATRLVVAVIGIAVFVGGFAISFVAMHFLARSGWIR